MGISPLDYKVQPLEIGGQRWCIRVYYTSLSPGPVPPLKKALKGYLMNKAHGREVSGSKTTPEAKPGMNSKWYNLCDKSKNNNNNNV